MFYQNILQKCPETFKLDTKIHGGAIHRHKEGPLSSFKF